jgi:hypothetical protein
MLIASAVVNGFSEAITRLERRESKLEAKVKDINVRVCKTS